MVHSIPRSWTGLIPNHSFEETEFETVQSIKILTRLVVFKSEDRGEKLQVIHRAGVEADSVKDEAVYLLAFPGDRIPSWFECINSFARSTVSFVREVANGFDIPLKLPGRIVDPPVCVPMAMAAWKSATAAPEPEEDPPGVRDGSCGLQVTGPSTVDANSVV